MSSKESGAERSAEGYYYCKVCQQTFFGTYAVDSRCINTRKCAGEVRKCAGVLEAIASPKELSLTLEKRFWRDSARSGDPFEIWKLVTECKDIFVTHVIPRLTSQDLKCFKEVNRASREVVKEAHAMEKLKKKFQIRELTSVASLRWAFNRFDGNEEDFFASVAMSGNLSFVRWCRKFMKWDYRVCTYAASRGDIAMLKYARSRKNPNTGNKVCEMKGHGACACNAAADNGSLECLKFAFQEKCGCSGNCQNRDNVLDFTARRGHLELLKWAKEEAKLDWPEGESDDDEPDLLSFTSCKAAALGGHLDCLKYCREKGCAWGLWVMESAAFSGSLDCLRYACENGASWSFFDFDEGSEIFDDGDEFWYGVTQYAAAMGWLDIVQYCFEHGAPWSTFTCEYAAKNNHLAMLRYALANGASFAQDYDWDDISEDWLGVGSHCAKMGNREMMELAHQSGAEWGSLTTEYAIFYNHFDCLQYAFEHGAEDADPGGFSMWEVEDDYADDIGEAARNGNFAMLKYIVEVMKREICERYFDDEGDMEERNAAASGSLECLKYIHSLLEAKGYPFLGQACIDAARNGHLNCVQYVVENAKMTLKEGAEILSEACAEAKRLKRYTCLEYLRSLLKHD